MTRPRRKFPEPCRISGTCVGITRGYPPVYCTRSGTINRDGRVFCRQHDPGDPEEKRQTRLARWAEQEARLQAEQDANQRRRLEEEACKGFTNEQLKEMITAAQSKTPARPGRRREKREMPSHERELPEGPILEIHLYRDPWINLVGSHVHMCPECFEDVPCADTCAWDGESTTNQGVPTCHPVICERCEMAGRLYHDQGGGI